MTLVEPTLEIVTLRPAEATKALQALVNAYTMPDGTEVVDQRTLRIFQKQLTDGYYYRLVWPVGVTEGEILEWYDMTARVLRLHKLGLV